MEGMRRFRIEFSGKGYPSYRPSSMTMFSQDEKTAGEWAKKQLAAWKLEGTPDVKCSIKEVLPEPPPKADVEEKRPRKGKK